MSGPPPHPPLGFAVAVTGHRPARIVDPQAVHQRIAELLEQLAAILGSTPRLVSALAEGTDRIGAEAALAAGAALEVVLPFRAAEYERDFPEAPACDHFRTLLARAEAVLVLDGAADSRDRAYEAAGKALLDNCDLVVAVWDGQPGRGRGGTFEIMAEAALRGLPLVVITPDGRDASLRLPALAGQGAKRVEDLREAPLSELPSVVLQIANLPNAKAQEQWLAAASLPRTSWVHGAYPLLLRLIGLGKKKRRGGAQAPPEPPPPSLLEQAFAWWDGSATVAAQAFRSAVIVNFALAALAVLLAAFSVLAETAKWLFVVAEVAVILLLLVNTWHAGRDRWQERWLEAREVAEMLRVTLMLRAAGIGRGIGDAGESVGGAAYVRALARAAPLPAANLSDPAAGGRALVEEVAGQAGWNEANEKRMHRAAHRIERIGESLFAAVLVAAIGWLILYLAAPDIAGRFKYALTAVTAGFPAVATASYGIRIILDFEGVAERSRRMAAALRALIARWEAGPQTAAAFQAFAGEAADIMLGDVAAWRLLAEGRRLAIPG